MLSKEASSIIFLVFGMTRPGIAPSSPGPLTNTLTIIFHSKYRYSNNIFFYLSRSERRVCWGQSLIERSILLIQEYYHLAGNRNFHLFLKKPSFFKIKRLSRWLNTPLDSSKIPSIYYVNPFLVCLWSLCLSGPNSVVLIPLNVLMFFSYFFERPSHVSAPFTIDTKDIEYLTTKAINLITFERMSVSLFPIWH